MMCQRVMYVQVACRMHLGLDGLVACLVRPDPQMLALTAALSQMSMIRATHVRGGSLPDYIEIHRRSVNRNPDS